MFGASSEPASVMEFGFKRERVSQREALHRQKAAIQQYSKYNLLNGGLIDPTDS